MKKIFFIGIVLFSGLLLGIGKFSLVEAKQVHMTIVNEPETDYPINIKVWAIPDDFPRSHAGYIDWVDIRTTNILPFDLPLSKYEKVEFCVERDKVSGEICKTFSSDYLKNNVGVDLETPLHPNDYQPRSLPQETKRLANCGELWAGCEGLDINPFN